MNKKITLSFLAIIGIAGFTYLSTNNRIEKEFPKSAWEIQLQKKKDKKAQGYHKLDKPDEFAFFHQGIRTKEGEDAPNYPVNYAMKALRKAVKDNKVNQARIVSGVDETIVWTERGPANVPGRTRALIVLPSDDSHNTWIAGSVGGGIWKTTDGGSSWINKTKDLPNLAFTSIAIAESNPNVLYAATGEGGLGGTGSITGNGLFKSTDEGESWTILSSTSNDFAYQNINRVIVDPNNENVVLMCTSNRAKGKSGIYKSSDGGVSWTNTYLDETTSRGIQQIVATPSDFNVLYAASNGQGVWKSTNAGDSWVLSNTGMNPTGRIEVAVSPVNSNRIFASVEGSDLYMSDDSAVSWSLVDVSFNGSSAEYLGGQGWYDNVILCSPYDVDVVYIGGVSLVQVTMGDGGTFTQTKFILKENGTEEFMSFVSFGANGLGGILDIGNDADDTSVELRFGPGFSQMAHRFTVPEGAGSGVSESDYTYQDYVEVPFEVWDIDSNRQLMVSFRDQQRDEIFNLLNENTAGGASTHSREYVYISNVDYDAATPDASIAVNGGQEFKKMYFFWPTLSATSWNPNDLPISTLGFVYESLEVKNATTDIVADAYSDFDGTNSFNTFGVDVHPDHHGLVAIKTDEANKMFKLLLSNDGGPFISKDSNNPGVSDGDWTMVGKTYNTSQFYGADKKPGVDEYFGGMQDNGTWQSPTNPDATANYNFRIGGDGFEVLWNNLDGEKLIGGSQNNGFRRSINGGTTFTGATTGLSGDAPFISKLSNSKSLPNVIYTVTSDGVFKSKNFGASWNLSAITTSWGASTFLDVEVSRANPDIVWAGSGMSSSRKIHLSTDQGVSFTETELYAEATLGTITKLASHPTEPNTAYVLFSFSESPKILKTEDLGQTWTDISGFGANTTSDRGFPDVAVYCLYVRLDNRDILWAGTDIGIVESIDNGASWHLLDSELPKVAVWDMKGQDNQVVIATHGRGIWTATLENSQTRISPSLAGYGVSPQNNLILNINTVESFDSTQVIIDDVLEETIFSISIGDYQLSFDNIDTGAKKVILKSYYNGAYIQSIEYSITHIDLLNYTKEYSNVLNDANDFIVEEMSVSKFSTTQLKSLQSPHDYSNNSNLSATLIQPIIVSSLNSTFNYEDIAIVQPKEAGSSFGENSFNDYVVVEATKDGVTWLPIEDGYDASAYSEWESAFNDNSTVTTSMYKKRTVDLTNNFNVGDTLLFRFRLYSDAETTGWGWSVDNIYIQLEPLAISEASEIEKFTVYPVPSAGVFNLNYNLKKQTPVSVSIIDATGKVIFEHELGSQTIGLHQYKLDNLKLENGLYFISLKTQTGKINKRVLFFN